MKKGTHQFDLFCTSTQRPYFDLNLTSTFLAKLYFDQNCTSTFCQIWASYWSRSTGRSTVLVEV